MRVGSWRATRALILLVALSVLVVPTALGGAAQSADAIYTAPDVGSGAMVNETPNAWFVQTKGSVQTFRSQAGRVGASYTERFTYDRLWNGVSVRASAKDAGLLSRLPSVQAVFPVLTVSLPKTDNSPDLATALDMTGARATQTQLGYTGAGVKVAVMDTGIDYHHPDLGGCFGAGCRVTTGWDFVGDAFNADPASASYNPNPAPDPDPDDCNGHGSHVSGIVGAKAASASGVTGVAPGVTFGAYRVFGCEGSTTADIMLAAMERAQADGMHVLNMSIGSAFNTWPQYPTAMAADALVDAGMHVVTSIGNSGANGVYSASAPGVGNNVLAVANFVNTHVSALTFNVNPGGRQVPYLQLADTLTAPTSGTTPQVVYVGRGCPQSGPSWNLPQADPYLADPAGKVALIDRGVCTFEGKYARAVAAGATAVVIANNVTGLNAGGGVINRGVVGVTISLADGDAIKALLAGGVTFTWTNTRLNAVNPNGGLMDSSSSYGMTAELKIKPNIGAPGGLIRSTYPLTAGDRSGYAILSGTSMASPHVAGATALLLQAQPGTSPARAKMLFQNSADPALLSVAPTSGLPEVVHRQGAGMIDIDDSILAKATVSPSEVALGEGTGGSFTLTIANNGTSAVTYTPVHQPAASTGGATNAPGFFGPHQTASFSAGSVPVSAGGTATLGVTIAAAVAQGRQYGGFIRLNGSDGSVLRVPYAGFSGDYQAIQVLVPTANGFPWLARLAGNTFTKQSDGAFFSMIGDDIPQFLVHLEHQSRLLEFEVWNVRTGAPAGSFSIDSVFAREEYLPRNSTATGFFAWSWDGTLPVRGTDIRMLQRSGTYFVKLKVLKALGDPSNPAHTETWTSPTFTIGRG